MSAPAEFKPDCDRECSITRVKGGYDYGLKHSDFCPHRSKPPPTELDALRAEVARLQREVEEARAALAREQREAVAQIALLEADMSSLRAEMTRTQLAYEHRAEELREYEMNASCGVGWERRMDEWRKMKAERDARLSPEVVEKVKEVLRYARHHIRPDPSERIRACEPDCPPCAALALLGGGK